MLNREAELLALLNSAPVVDGEIVETLTDVDQQRLRDDLHRVIRNAAEPSVLSTYLDGVEKVPTMTSAGLEWALAGPTGSLPLAEMVLEWSRIHSELPGRLRACGNPECNKFLIDHSKPNTAKWCSMASCGNRMKARRYQARHNSDEGAPSRSGVASTRR